MAFVEADVHDSSPAYCACPTAQFFVSALEQRSLLMVWLVQGLVCLGMTVPMLKIHFPCPLLSSHHSFRGGYAASSIYF